MKAILLISLVLMLPSCAQIKGNSITGEYSATFVMTDVGAYSQTSKRAVMSKMNQSKVALSAIRTVGVYGGALVAGNLAEAVSQHGSNEVINASNNAAAGIAAKEATKQAAISAKSAEELARIAKP